MKFTIYINLNRLNDIRTIKFIRYFSNKFALFQPTDGVKLDINLESNLSEEEYESERVIISKKQLTTIKKIIE